MLTGEAVNFHFADGRTVREIVKWLASSGLRVEVNFRSPVVTVREKSYTAPVRGFDDRHEFDICVIADGVIAEHAPLFKSDGYFIAVEQSCRNGSQSRLNLPARFENRRAV